MSNNPTTSWIRPVAARTGNSSGPSAPPITNVLGRNASGTATSAINAYGRDGATSPIEAKPAASAPM